MAEATLGVLPNPFTMEDFLSGVDHLHGIADFRDISTMLKHLIDTGAMHSTDDPPGSWTRGPV